MRVRVITSATPRRARDQVTMLVPVTKSVWGMEYSVHECPKRHKAEAEAMFPGLDVSDLLVVPTCQVRVVTKPPARGAFPENRPARARPRFVPPPRLDRPSPTPPRLPRVRARPAAQRTKMDLVQTGESVDTEKDFCLERFMTFAKNVTDRLIADGPLGRLHRPVQRPLHGEQGLAADLRRGGRARHPAQLPDHQQRVLQGGAPSHLGLRGVPGVHLHKGAPSGLADAVAEAEKEIRAADGDA